MKLDVPTAAALTEILVRLVDGGASIRFLAPMDPDEAARYWAQVCQPHRVLLLAEQDKRIVGTAQLQLHTTYPNGSHRAEVAKVLVHPEFQRRGIGRALIRRIEAVAR